MDEIARKGALHGAVEPEFGAFKRRERAKLNADLTHDGASA